MDLNDYNWVTTYIKIIEGQLGLQDPLWSQDPTAVPSVERMQQK